MTLWHASTELHATADAVVAKTVYLAAQLMGRVEKSLGLDRGMHSAELAERGELDTSG